MIIAILSLSAIVPVAGAQFDSDVRRDLASALRSVRPLVRDDPQRALRILRSLEAEHPTHPQLLLTMAEVYVVMGEVDSARVTYERCIRVHPTNVRAAASLGMLYIQDGDNDQGMRVFNEILRQTEYGVGTYRAIGSTLSNAGFFDLALSLYEKGRARGDATLLTVDIAYLHRLMGNDDAALAEYIRLVETSPRQHELAKTRILELIGDSNADAGALLDTLRHTSEEPGPNRRMLREILAMAYLEEGMLEDAFEIALLADEGSNGDVLFELASRTVEVYNSQAGPDKTRYFDLGLRSLEVFLDHHSESPQVPRAKLLLVDLLVDLSAGRVRVGPTMNLDLSIVRALNALDWLIDEFPGTEYAEQAYLKKGDVVFRLQKDPQGALDIYKTGLSRSRYYPTEFAERLGRTYLVVEQYEQAQSYFGRLLRANSRELQEAGFYYTGLLLAFTNRYEAARDTLTALAESNPASSYANDAIELAWVIEEGLKGDQKNLTRFAEALRAEIAGDSARVVSELNGIIDQPQDTPLRARSLIKLGDTHVDWGGYEPALAAYERFMHDYPSDPLVPDVQRKIGQVYEHGYGNVAVALEKYEGILLAYPHYIFLDEVRKDVVRLRGEMQP